MASAIARKTAKRIAVRQRLGHQPAVAAGAPNRGRPAPTPAMRDARSRASARAGRAIGPGTKASAIRPAPRGGGGAPGGAVVPVLRRGAPSARRCCRPSPARAAAARHRLVLVEQIGQHVAGDRRRGAGAAEAVLDHHRAGVARRADRREEDEQAVVAIAPGGAGAAALGADVADLRGAGLAGHLDVGEGQAAARRRCRCR